MALLASCLLLVIARRCRRKLSELRCSLGLQQLALRCHVNRMLPQHLRLRLEIPLHRPLRSTAVRMALAGAAVRHQLRALQAVTHLPRPAAKEAVHAAITPHLHMDCMMMVQPEMILIVIMGLEAAAAAECSRERWTYPALLLVPSQLARL